MRQRIFSFIIKSGILVKSLGGMVLLESTSVSKAVRILSEEPFLLALQNIFPLLRLTAMSMVVRARLTVDRVDEIKFAVEEPVPA